MRGRPIDKAQLGGSRRWSPSGHRDRAEHLSKNRLAVRRYIVQPTNGATFTPGFWRQYSGGWAWVEGRWNWGTQGEGE